MLACTATQFEKPKNAAPYICITSICSNVEALSRCTSTAHIVNNLFPHAACRLVSVLYCIVATMSIQLSDSKFGLKEARTFCNQGEDGITVHVEWNHISTPVWPQWSSRDVEVRAVGMPPWPKTAVKLGVHSILNWRHTPRNPPGNPVHIKKQPPGCGHYIL